ncbi:S8 family serine peptidase [Amycolatopsis minnesotensis]|uniref:S8 family serine peptidase n=1 Tax=Amycolatopsis minnesotensis TaxID=337894 RepID=A0ABN2RUA7_9PSEU
MPLAVLTAVAGMAVAPATAAAAAPTCGTGPSYPYIVLYAPHTPPALVDAELAAKCGSRTGYYPEIGVAVAASADPGFAGKIGVHRAYSGKKEITDAGGPDPAVARAGVTAQQWDMRAIKAPEANRIYQGSAAVTVGVLDSGVDATHPALKNAVDPDASAGCGTGVPDPSAWGPVGDVFHGTHVAGTIAAKDPANGFTGIAPGVRIASVRLSDSPQGWVYPEAAVCGLVWAADHHFPVVNASWSVDPGLFYCADQPGEAAVFEAVRRAAAYARRNGVLVVAAAGNNGFDLTKQTEDPIPVPQYPVTPACKSLPQGLPGVVTVSSVGYSGTKAATSNYGAGAVRLTAPGGANGDSPPDGQGVDCPLSTALDGGYRAICGTSMAAPHVAGVAALLASRHPHASPARLAALLEAQADPVPCPAGTDCTGTDRDNSYYGRGRVNALRAVR